MAASLGRGFLLKVGSGVSAVTVAAMRSTSFTVNGETVDGTTKDSSGMRELVEAGGSASMSISASGILSANAQATDFVNAVIARTLATYEITFDNADKISGSFQVTSFQATGDYNGEQTYSISLESSGALTVTAAT